MKKYHFRTQLLLMLLLPFFCVHAQNDADTTALVKFEKVETEASYPGGSKTWIEYLQKNLNPNVPLDNGAPIGKYTVVVQFIVDKDGSVSDIKALTDLGYGMEAEVLRILKKSGNWTPAWQNGKIVKAYKKQPVTFVVEDDSITINSKWGYTFHTNTENKITVSVYKIKPEDIIIDLSAGTITKTGDDNYTIKVTDPGKRVLMTIKSKKKNKTLGVVSFEVQQGPY